MRNGKEVLDTQEQVTNMIKLKFIRNRPTLKFTTYTHETMTFDPTEMIDILDLIFGLVQNKARSK